MLSTWTPRVLLAHRPGDGARLRAAVETTGALELARVTTSARLALQVFDPAWHDVVVTDDSLSDATGFELIKRLHHVAPTTTAVVALGHLDPPAIASALQAGASGVVALDAVDDDLVAVVLAAVAGVCAIDRRSAGVLAASWPLEIERLLSARELEVLECLGRGMTNAQVGATLYVSRETVKSHVANVLRKLEVGDRAAAVARARQVGLLTRSDARQGMLA